jgi:hypothetical protein
VLVLFDDDDVNAVARTVTLNSIVNWLPLLLHIQDVPTSNHSVETGYPDVYKWFSSVQEQITG